MPLLSDIDDLGQWLRDTISEFGFDTQHDEHGTVGNACAVEVAHAIRELGEQGLGPDMEDWPVNSERYLEWKLAHFPESDGKTNYRTLQMLSDESLLANVEVTHDTVTMGYGTGNPSDKELRKDPIPDTMKAHYAHEQKREFFAIGDHAEDRVFHKVADALGEHLQRKADSQ